MFSSLPEPDALTRAHSDRLLAQLRQQIVRHGPLSFSQYMERCLYTPELGYYSSNTTPFGVAGDFVTAPELGTLFACSMANVIRPVLGALGEDACVLEMGGGSGAFAQVLLQALATGGSWPYRYLMLEPSAALRQRQGERLIDALPPALLARVQWLDHPPRQPWHGVLFANEVIDALPVTRFTLKEGQVYEEYVNLDDEGGLVRTDRLADARVTAAVRHIERDLGTALADGYRSEVLPHLPYWMQDVTGALENGMALFIDYGYVRREFYLPGRGDGTLMAHYRHNAHTDPLWLPGLNDLTASVDFTALAEAGHQAGLDLAVYTSQAQFLLGAGLQAIFEDGYARAMDEMTRYRLSQEERRLILPDQMGERFQAMLLTRNREHLPLSAELLASDQAARL